MQPCCRGRRRGSLAWAQGARGAWARKARRPLRRAAHLRCPVRVDVVAREVPRREAVHLLVHRLGAEATQAKRREVVRREEGGGIRKRHEHP